MTPLLHFYMNEERIIGKYTGLQKGPLFVVIGGIHGNEPAGITAINHICRMLLGEPEINPSFVLSGIFLGMTGNIPACRAGQRYVRLDLNRIWNEDYLSRVLSLPPEDLQDEEKEMYELYHIIMQYKDHPQIDRLVILDLHTTSASGGIFSIPSDDPESLRIALELHAPVIKGMTKGISGSILHYFKKDVTGIDTISLAFEAGHHHDPLSVNRSIAAIINCMRSIGSVQPKDLENQHDNLLLEYAKKLPRVTEMIYKYGIGEGEHFKMVDGYNNFQFVKKGEMLAVDKNGPVKASDDGLLLMPLYQQQGQDGFFIVKEVEGY